MADSGHYVAWVKEEDDSWLKFDDDKVSIVDNEEIKKLTGKGGGDWHMAYIILYRSKKIDPVELQQYQQKQQEEATKKEETTSSSTSASTATTTNMDTS